MLSFPFFCFQTLRHPSILFSHTGRAVCSLKHMDLGVNNMKWRQMSCSVTPPFAVVHSILINLSLTYSTWKHTHTPHPGHLRLLAWGCQKRMASEWSDWRLYSTWALAGPQTRTLFELALLFLSSKPLWTRWAVTLRGAEECFYDSVLELESLWGRSSQLVLWRLAGAGKRFVGPQKPGFEFEHLDRSSHQNFFCKNTWSNKNRRRICITVKSNHFHHWPKSVKNTNTISNFSRSNHIVFSYFTFPCCIFFSSAISSLLCSYPESSS